MANDSLSADIARRLEEEISSLTTNGADFEEIQKVEHLQAWVHKQFDGRTDITSEEFMAMLDQSSELNTEEKKKFQEYATAVASANYEIAEYSVYKKELSREANEWREQNTEYLDLLYNNDFAVSNDSEFYTFYEKDIEADAQDAKTSMEKLQSGLFGAAILPNKIDLVLNNEAIAKQATKHLKISENLGNTSTNIKCACDHLDKLHAEGKPEKALENAVEDTIPGMTGREIIKIWKDPESRAELEKISDLHAQRNALFTDGNMTLEAIAGLSKEKREELTQINQDIGRSGMALARSHPAVLKSLDLEGKPAEERGQVIASYFDQQYEQNSKTVNQYQTLSNIREGIHGSEENTVRLIHGLDPELRNDLNEQLAFNDGIIEPDTYAKYIHSMPQGLKDHFKAIDPNFDPESLVTKFEKDEDFRVVASVMVEDAIHKYNTHEGDKEELGDFKNKSKEEITAALKEKGLLAKFSDSVSGFFANVKDGLGLGDKEEQKKQEVLASDAVKPVGKEDPHGCHCDHEKEEKPKGPPHEERVATAQQQATEALKPKADAPTPPAAPTEITAAAEVAAKQQASAGVGA